MSEAFLGEIRIFTGNFEPRNWAFCNGQLLRIQQNTALFSLLGTNYGGDGKTTFGLPDLRGAVPMQWGHGRGLTPRSVGEMGGSPRVTLTTAQLPVHSHAMAASQSPAQATDPRDAVPADAPIYASAPPTTPMAVYSVRPSGSSQPHNNMQPYLAVNFIIALQGIFPPRG